MSTTTTVDVVGTPLDRVDGRLKVMGAATYPIDVILPGLVYAAEMRPAWGEVAIVRPHRGAQAGAALGDRGSGTVPRRSSRAELGRDDDQETA
jgi:hypothetical protein